jgi:hypothetical protein
MRQLSLVITAILAATALSVITTPLVYAQESFPDVEFNINKQKGVVSGQSCSTNLIGSGTCISNLPGVGSCPSR